MELQSQGLLQHIHMKNFEFYDVKVLGEMGSGDVNDLGKRH